MESHGHPGTVHCSAALAADLARPAELACMGVQPVKGKGPMTTYVAKVGRAVLSQKSLITDSSLQ